jgi:transcription antitermination factor NusG
VPSLASSVEYVHLVNATKISLLEQRDIPWYVVWSEARAEKKVAERLVAKGFSVWLPTVTEKHRWSDRWKMVTKPLFPGYLFAATGAGYVPLLKTPGVLTLVKEGGAPAQLTADYIVSLRRIVEHPELAVESVELQTRYLPGDEVLVRGGPLTGYRGQVIELKGSRRLVVWIPSVGRGLLCTLGDALVTRVSETAA